jgi:hypothetical protein
MGSSDCVHTQKTENVKLSLYLRSEVFTAVTMKNAVFWDVAQCSSCKNRRSVRRLLVTANIVPSSPILVILILEALGSSETSILTRAIRHYIPEDGSLHIPVFN